MIGGVGVRRTWVAQTLEIWHDAIYSRSVSKARCQNWNVNLPIGPWYVQYPPDRKSTSLNRENVSQFGWWMVATTIVSVSWANVLTSAPVIIMSLMATN